MNSKANNMLTQEMERFRSHCQPRRLSRNLRGLLLGMLQAQPDGYPFDLDDLLYDMTALFELLDAVEDCPNKRYG